jgi:hypothetical protein
MGCCSSPAFWFMLIEKKQGSGSRSGLDPDSMTLWIRIRIGNPDPGSGGKKMKKNKYFF